MLLVGKFSKNTGIEEILEVFFGKGIQISYANEDIRGANELFDDEDIES